MVTRDELGNVETPVVHKDGLENLRVWELRQKCVEAGFQAGDADQWNKDRCIAELRARKTFGLSPSFIEE